MEQKHVVKLLKAYREFKEEKPHIGCYLSFEEYEENLKKTYYRLLSNLPIDKIISFLLRAESVDKGLRIYEAFSVYDMEALNNALYEIAHLLQVGNISSPSTDHTYYSFNIMPELLAANMTDRISCILPIENGMCYSNVVGTVIIDLFMAIWYQNEEFEQIALSIAKKKLETKLTQYDKAYILYLMAIMRKDVKEASLQLEEMCAGHKKSKQFGMNSFNKAFALGVHGMYNLSHHVYDGQLSGKVKMPIADNFCQDLAIWQQENGNKPGKVIHIYSEPVDVMNAIMEIQPPIMQLYKKSSKEVYLNTKLFEEEEVKLIKEIYVKGE